MSRWAKYIDSDPFKIIGETADKLQLETFVIGGFVRDKILNRGEAKDIDFVCKGSGIELAQAVAKALPGKPKVQVFKNFGTAMIKHNELELEFVGARKESYRANSRKPLVEDGSLEDDQKRRDFTINALAISLNEKNWGELIDPFGGLEDLENKILRTPLNPDQTYFDDPLRMMRAVRFASQLNFSIEEESFKALSRNAERLKIISKERISDELNKIILSKIPSKGFKILFNTQLLHQFFPQMVALHGVETRNGKSHKDNFYHTLEVLDNISKETDNLWLRWAAILHDIAKPPTKKFEPGIGWTFHGHEFLGSKMTTKIFRQLKLPMNEKMKYVQKLVKLHLRPIALVKEEVTDSAIRRLLFEAGDNIGDLMTLCNADITSKNEMRKKRYRDNFKKVQEKIKSVEERDHVKNFQPPVDGELIMKTFRIKPGREIGILKNAIKEAILEGEIPNEFEPAYQYMIEKAKDLNLSPVNTNKSN